MPCPNGSELRPSFVLAAPGPAGSQAWLPALLCGAYAAALAGNGAVLLALRPGRGPLAPAGLFLAMLAAVDLALCTAAVPRALLLSWSGAREIGFGACLLQMFLIHALSAVESALLLALALDRCVAICHPLRHAALFEPAAAARLGLAAVARAVLFFLPLPLLLLPLPFCGPRALSHSFCLHQDVMNLACARATPSLVYGLAAVLLVMGLDAVLICLSYLLILKAVLRLAAWRERLKVFGTCAAHVCAVLAFYVPLVGLSVVHRFGRDLAPPVHVVMGNIYILVPAVLNPIIYGVRTKQIRRRIRSLIHVGDRTSQ